MARKEYQPGDAVAYPERRRWYPGKIVEVIIVETIKTTIGESREPEVERRTMRKYAVAYRLANGNQVRRIVYGHELKPAAEVTT